MIIEASEELEVVKSFDELGLREELQRGNKFERSSLPSNKLLNCLF